MFPTLKTGSNLQFGIGLLLLLLDGGIEEGPPAEESSEAATANQLEKGILIDPAHTNGNTCEGKADDTDYLLDGFPSKPSSHFRNSQNVIRSSSGSGSVTGGATGGSPRLKASYASLP